jgi:uncharacterized phiE125 gp8 family phage protein
MSLQRLSIDRTTLPQAMLSLAKQQMRVDHDEDDQIIVHKLAHAINLVELVTSFSVSKAVWTWTPGVLNGESEQIPVMRVSSWTAKDGNGVDITSSYALEGDINPDSIALQYLTGPTGSTVEPTVTLNTGFATLNDMPPAMLDVILRIAAYLYEWREIQNIPGVDGVAYANSLITNWWIPRA